MSEEDLPTVVAEEVVEFAGHKVRLLVLSSGQRIIPQEDCLRVLETLGISAYEAAGEMVSVMDNRKRN